MDSTALVESINELRRSRNAVVLAHNYQLAEIQEIADFLGDSLDLSRKAQATDADVIVFCGVHFMAETAAILSPQKTVLLPELKAGCPMADTVDAASLRAKRAEHPEAIVICYVNTSAEVKAECDVCCTSANAAEIVGRYPKDQEIIFVPDRNLGANVERQLGREMILWEGCCNVHDRITPRDVEQRKAEFPEAEVLVHPECRPEVVALADGALSTSGILQRAQQSTAKTIIVGTELGIIHRLRKENPDKRFVALTEQAICPDMKWITLPSVHRALETMEPRIEIEESIRKGAEKAVLRMTGDDV